MRDGMTSAERERVKAKEYPVLARGKRITPFLLRYPDLSPIVYFIRQLSDIDRLLDRSHGDIILSVAAS